MKVRCDIMLGVDAANGLSCLWDGSENEKCKSAVVVDTFFLFAFWSSLRFRRTGESGRGDRGDGNRVRERQGDDRTYHNHVTQDDNYVYKGELADFSSRGPASSNDVRRIKPDVCAPGIYVTSTHSRYDQDTDTNKLYTIFSGTSRSFRRPVWPRRSSAS